MIKRPEFFGPILSLLFLCALIRLLKLFTQFDSVSVSILNDLIFCIFKMKPLELTLFCKAFWGENPLKKLSNIMIFTKSFWKLHNLDLCIVQPQNSLGSEVLLARKLMVAAFLSASMAWSYCETWDYRRQRHWEPVWEISLRNLWIGPRKNEVGEL